MYCGAINFAPDLVKVLVPSTRVMFYALIWASFAQREMARMLGNPLFANEIFRLPVHRAGIIDDSAKNEPNYMVINGHLLLERSRGIHIVQQGSCLATILGTGESMWR